MTTPPRYAVSPADPAAGSSTIAPDAAAGLRLSKVYGSDETRVIALDQVDVRFARGTFTAIMGPSGSGKSTLMHCLAGLDTITSGRAFLNGHELNTMPDKQLTRLRREEVGFIFQSFNLLPMLTAKQNILLPLELAGRKPDKELFDQIVDELGIANRLGTVPRSSRVVSSNAWPAPAPW